MLISLISQVIIDKNTSDTLSHDDPTDLTRAPPAICHTLTGGTGLFSMFIVHSLRLTPARALLMPVNRFLLTYTSPAQRRCGTYMLPIFGNALCCDLACFPGLRKARKDIEIGAEVSKEPCGGIVAGSLELVVQLKPCLEHRAVTLIFLDTVRHVVEYFNVAHKESFGMNVKRQEKVD